jgi:hypothetical protein
MYRALETRRALEAQRDADLARAPINDAVKLAEIRREISMRRRLYPGWVAKGTMHQVTADRQIAIMEAIASDYATKIETETAKERLL